MAAKFLKQHDVITSIGYDQNNIENFLFFWSESYKDYYKFPDDYREYPEILLMQMLEIAIKFIAKRPRAWLLIIFSDRDG